MWSLKLEQEVEKNKALVEALQSLATEQPQPSPCRSGRSSTLSVLNHDDFFDALSGQHLLVDRYFCGVPTFQQTLFRLA